MGLQPGVNRAHDARGLAEAALAGLALSLSASRLVAAALRPEAVRRRAGYEVVAIGVFRKSTAL
jgi:hypothetical protein